MVTCEGNAQCKDLPALGFTLVARKKSRTESSHAKLALHEGPFAQHRFVHIDDKRPSSGCGPLGSEWIASNPYGDFAIGRLYSRFR